MSGILLNQCPRIQSAQDAVLLDIGDGIVCLEFNSKGNSITPAIKEFILKILEDNLYGYKGMVIGSQSKNFSVGANLNVMKQNLDKKDYKAFDRNVRSMQAVTMAIKHFGKPVVAAPYRRVLGGGLEIALHCHSRAARRDCMMGLVEIGVGLVPAGGGTKECALRIGRAGSEDQKAVIKTIFEKILLRQVSKDAVHAAEMLYLTDKDVIEAEDERLLITAKELCLQMAKNKPHSQEEEIKVTLPGREAYNWMIDYGTQLAEEGKVSPYDTVVGKYLAEILAGSSESGPAVYSERQLLDKEREAFVALAHETGTYDRITYFTEHNMLLRN